MPSYVCVKGSLQNNQIDFDNSNNEACKVDKENQLLLNLYPNPANSEIYIDLNVVIPGDANLEIFDKTGRMVYSGQIKLTAKFNRLIIDIKNFAKGKYTIRLNAPEGETSADFIKY